MPTMIFGADGDTVAPVDTFASPNTTVAEYSIVWLKRFVDNDTRYDQFICPTPNDANTVAFQNTCPM